MDDSTPGSRSFFSFYLNRYSDEVVPCEPSLEGWAAWLATDDPSWPHEIASDGEGFAASATLWLPDIVATFDGEAWCLSRDPDGDFLAVRFGRGTGWNSDAIVDGREMLLEYLDDCGPAELGQEEFVACGTHESGWRVVFHAGSPPTCTAERVQ